MVGDNSTQEPAGHDAQRVLEQKALRNVRGLVDRMQAEEEKERRSRKWAVGVLIAAVVAVGAIVAASLNRKPTGTQEIVVPPASKEPTR